MSAQADEMRTQNINNTPTSHHGKGQLVCPSLGSIPLGPSRAAGIEAVDIGAAHSENWHVAKSPCHTYTASRYIMFAHVFTD